MCTDETAEGATQAGPAVPLEAESDDYRDDDSALGDDQTLASSTTSLSSTILKYREENGRTYHAYKDGKYLYPNDEGENDRLDMQHHIYNLSYDGKLFTCPIDKDFKVHRVLDVGTGTGIWAIDYGDEHPEASVLGIDLSPIQPEFTPPNVTFEVDDAEEPWTYTQKFDFVHARMMTGSFANVPRFFDQVFENTTPGGYIELSDIVLPAACDDGTMKPDSALYQWGALCVDASKKVGRDLGATGTYKKEMQRVGYTDIVEKMYIWPMNKWPKDPKLKELGMWMCENCVSGVGGLSMALFTRVHGWSVEELETFLVSVRKDMRDTRIHAYWNIRTIYGRKPLES